MHPHSEVFPGRLAFPPHALVEGVHHFIGSGYGAVDFAVTTEITFIRIQHNGRLPRLGVGYEDIHPTHVHTHIAARAEVRVEHHGFTWS